MAMIAPIAEAALGAEGAAGAAGASRLGSFAQGFKNMIPGSLSNYSGDKPVVGPQPSPLADVGALAKDTVNPNAAR